jgi:hypothetical protein
VKKIVYLTTLFLLVIGVFACVYYFVFEKQTFVQTTKENENKLFISSSSKTIINAIDKTTINQPKNYYIKDVPFIVQAPNADWKNERLQDGCEEASAVILSGWYNNEGSIWKSEALKRILAASTWLETNTNTFHDNSVEDIVRLLKEKYYIKIADILENPTLDEIKIKLRENKLVLVPTNGQLLGNPYFSGAGPERHMIIIRGYDDDKEMFIVNDPGTKRGENYHYSYQTVLLANLAYPSGYHEKITTERKAVIVVGK